MCTDITCSEGVVADPDCNGWGVRTPGGRKYRKRSKVENRAGGVPCPTCRGTAMIACGCVDLSVEMLDMLEGKAFAEIDAPLTENEAAWAAHAPTAA